jgi:murein DD-endopeptidase MepM/ murein hydrolase activator NlpD
MGISYRLNLPLRHLGITIPNRMTLFDHPLKDRYLTQSFGADPITYSRFGMNGHNGWDYRCANETVVYAVCDGTATQFTDAGYGVNIRLDTEPNRDGEYLEVVYGHLKTVVKEGKVLKGEPIALSNNTGFSSGPHLHLGVRRRRKEGSGSVVLNYDNGFLGYYDPVIHYPKDVWYRRGVEFKLPVDDCYGETKPGMSWLQWQKANAWIFKTYRRLMTDREMKALRYGYWHIGALLDPTMYTVWSQKTKPAHLKKLGKLPL